MKQAGALVLPNLVGSPVYIPKQLTSADIYWIGQNAPITLSNPTFGSITMTPKTMAARAQYSNLLALLANPNAEELMRRDFARIAALELDRVVLRGAGTLEPVGIANMANIPTLALGTDGGAFDWAAAVEAEGMLEDSNALVPDGKFAFITHGKVKRRLKLTRIPQYSGDPGGAYVVPPIISDRALADMLGYPIFTTSQVRTNLTKAGGSNLSEVYFANWADVVIGVWGNRNSGDECRRERLRAEPHGDPRHHER
jgi:HK97 family phage major capsid protein